MSDEAALIEALRAAAGLPAGAVERFDHGASGDVTVCIGAVFAKIANPARRISREGLAREAAALRWLDGRGGAPRVLRSGQVEGRPAMVVELLPGNPIHALPPNEAEAALIAAIHALHSLHGLPVLDCPLDQRLVAKIAEARQRIAEGEAEPRIFDAGRTGRTASELFEELIATAPAEADAVFTLGDACLPNFILNGDWVGVVDLGLAGVGDPYCDFALLLRSAASNFPDIDARALLVAHYPLPELDDAKIAFFQRRDAFF